MSFARSERLDPAAFREWCECWLNERTGQDERVRVTELCRLLGIPTRRLYRWRFENSELHRGELEAALEHADMPIEDMYPILAPDSDAPTHGYCTSCKEEVPINEQRLCLWCDRKTWRRKGGWEPGVLCKLDDHHLRALHQLHAKGVPVSVLGRRIWKKAGYASERSAKMAISRGFKRLHLPTFKSGGAATFRRCRGIKGKTGRRCEREANIGSDYCWGHDPELRSQVVEHIASAREKLEAAA